MNRGWRPSRCTMSPTTRTATIRRSSGLSTWMHRLQVDGILVTAR